MAVDSIGWRHDSLFDELRARSITTPAVTDRSVTSTAPHPPSLPSPLLKLASALHLSPTSHSLPFLPHGPPSAAHPSTLLSSPPDSSPSSDFPKDSSTQLYHARCLHHTLPHTHHLPCSIITFPHPPGMSHHGVPHFLITFHAATRHRVGAASAVPEATGPAAGLHLPQPLPLLFTTPFTQHCFSIAFPTLLGPPVSLQLTY